MKRFPLTCFWIYYVSCACIVESCACQLYIKQIYDDDDMIRPVGYLATSKWYWAAAVGSSASRSMREAALIIPSCSETVRSLSASLPALQRIQHHHRHHHHQQQQQRLYSAVL